MNLSHLKAGDEVVVRFGKWQDNPRYELARVGRINKKTLTLTDGRAFSLKTGEVKYDKDILSQDICEMTMEIQIQLGGR